MSSPDVIIHPSAIVHPKAELDSGVWIGPGCVIGPTSVSGRTRSSNPTSRSSARPRSEPTAGSPRSSPSAPSPRTSATRATRRSSGSATGNVFKEFITVNRGTVKGGGITRIGDRNFLMAYTHVAHDCQVGSEIVFTNNATLGGHVVVEDYAMLSGFTGVHQFCRIGRYAFTGGFTVITQDVPPFCKVAGMRPVQIFGLNGVGLRRRGFSRREDPRPEGDDQDPVLLRPQHDPGPGTDRGVLPPGEDRDELLGFIRSSRRGIIKKTAEKWESESE